MFELNDYELLYLISQNNREAEETMLRKYELLIWKHTNGFFLNYVPQGVEKDDLFQEGLVALLNSLQAYDSYVGAPYFSFGEVCLVRSMIAYIRKYSSKRAKRFYNSIPLDAVVADNVGLYYNDVIADTKEVSALVKYNEAFGQLFLTHTQMSEFEKRVLVLQVSGYSYRESAYILDCTAKKIDNTLQKIKRILS